MARTAYAQLGYRAAALAGMIAALALVFLAPPLLVLLATGPGEAAAYMAFTLDSALAEWRGRGGMWKGEAGPRTDAGADSGLH